LNYKYFSSYEPRVGFRFGIERLHGLNQKVPHVVTVSIFPPGSLYANPPRKTPDVYFFSEFNGESPWNSVQFTDELVNYTGLPANETLAFIIDVKALKVT
jgi:hypothetical protein